MGESRTEALPGGNFYGTVERKREQCGAIFSDLRHYRPRRLPAHAHELPFFALLLQGNYHERYGGREIDFRPFTIAYRPAGVPHKDEIGPNGLRFFEIEIRPRWRKQLQECSLVPDTAYEDFHGGTLLWLGMKLFRETRGPSEDLVVESLLAETLGLVTNECQGRVSDVPPWMSRVVERIRFEYCERLTLNDLSIEAGVHPVHLSRVFRKSLRTGIGEYVHKLRISEACRQMLSPETTLAEVALSTGFTDQSHFTRAFRRITGTSPGEFREIVAVGRSKA